MEYFEWNGGYIKYKNYEKFMLIILALRRIKKNSLDYILTYELRIKYKLRVISSNNLKLNGTSNKNKGVANLKIRSIKDYLIID